MLKLGLTALLAVVLLAGCAQQSGPDRGEQLTDAPKYGKFIWHDLLTDDVAGAKAFYGELLGWSFEDTTRPSGGPYTLIRTANGTYVGGILEVNDPADGSDYSRWLGYYAVPDVDEAADAVAAAGGEIVLFPRPVGTVARGAVVTDPDGALVGLLTSRIGYPIDELATDEGGIIANELVTLNPAAAADLYAGLSASTVRTAEENGVDRWLLRNEGRDRALVLERPDERIDPLWLTYFAVGDPAATIARVEPLGGAVLLAPEPGIRGGTLALLTDPSGAVLGLQTRR